MISNGLCNHCALSNGILIGFYLEIRHRIYNFTENITFLSSPSLSPHLSPNIPNIFQKEGIGLLSSPIIIIIIEVYYLNNKSEQAKFVGDKILFKAIFCFS